MTECFNPECPRVGAILNKISSDGAFATRDVRTTVLGTVVRPRPVYFRVAPQVAYATRTTASYLPEVVMLHGNCIVEAVDNGSSVLRFYKEIRYRQINTVTFLV